MVRRKIEKVYNFKLDRHELSRLKKIVIIGCGGNGSHLVPHVARLMKGLDSKIEIILVDGDKVEEKNLIRQHFISTDVGTNKAEALAKRYGSALGVNIGFVSKYLTEEDGLGALSGGSSTLYITCTDNLQSRKLISEEEGSYWLDLGNEETSGQVSFSYLKGQGWGDQRVENNSSFRIPHVFEIFPDYNEKVKSEKSIEELSCAEIAEESPKQVGFVNLTCAAVAVNYVHALLTQTPISNHMTFFSIDNSFEHRPMTKTVVEDWKAKHSRFSNTVVG